jgi:hypothetical protein
MMIVGVYATLGVFLLMAARTHQPSQPDLVRRVVERRARRHHGGAVDAGEHHRHLLGDVPALFLVAIVLAGLLVWSDAGRGKGGVDGVPGAVAGRAAGGSAPAARSPP